MSLVSVVTSSVAALQGATAAACERGCLHEPLLELDDDERC